MDVQVDVGTDRAATAPRAQLVEGHGGLQIRIARTQDLHEALAIAASIGVTRFVLDYRFHDDGHASCRVTYRRAAGRGDVDVPTAEELGKQLRHLVQEAVLEAIGDRLGLDEHLDLEVTVSFTPRAACWSITGRGQVFEVVGPLNGVSVCLD